MRFFWRACVVCAFYGFISVALCCDPTFFAFPHSLPIMGYLYWFFRHVLHLVLCFYWGVCAACADGSCSGSCCCLVQRCRSSGFFPNFAVFVLVMGLSVLFQEFLALALVFLGCTCGVAFLAPFDSLALRPLPAVTNLGGFRCGPPHWLSLRLCVDLFSSGGAGSSFSPPAWRGVGCG